MKALGLLVGYAIASTPGPAIVALAGGGPGDIASLAALNAILAMFALLIVALGTEGP